MGIRKIDIFMIMTSEYSENKRAYLVGTGIPALAAGCFLIRDAHMDGSRICFREHLYIPEQVLEYDLI